MFAKKKESKKTKEFVHQPILGPISAYRAAELAIENKKRIEDNDRELRLERANEEKAEWERLAILAINKGIEVGKKGTMLDRYNCPLHPEVEMVFVNCGYTVEYSPASDRGPDRLIIKWDKDATVDELDIFYQTYA